MKTSLDARSVAHILAALPKSVQPATLARQPVHTVYGGAHLFRSDTAARLGALAQTHFARYAPDPVTFAAALGLDAPQALAETVYHRTAARLAREAVEDFRIDFEDGFGVRSDEEEDGTAIAAADALSVGLAAGSLPQMIGIRIKSMAGETQRRSVRTLDLFVTRLLEQAGRLPPRFVVTLPKVHNPEQVSVAVALLEQLERAVGLPAGALPIELMIETTAALLDRQGRIGLPMLIDAARGRCLSVHLGAYDLLAQADITAQHQTLDHPLCDTARQLLLLCCAQTAVAISDGATNVMPVGPHRGDPSSLSAEQEAENRAVVHAAWKIQHGHVRHSLRSGLYQGWDLHPGQIPVRYAACYAFFLEGLDAARTRLVNFVDQAARATRSGDIFDDAATGQGLLNTFIRALHCGAIDVDEIFAMGLTREEVEGRSFVKILENRRRL